MRQLGARWRTGLPWLTASAILVGLAAFAVWAYGGPVGQWIRGRPPRPVIHLSAVEVDFGRLRPLQEVERSVTIGNRGGRQLRLEEPTATCGCQKPLLSRASLDPGEHTQLILRQQASEKDGPFQHLIYVKSNDPITPLSQVYVFGVVSRGLVVRPEPLIFEPIGPGETRTRFLEVSSDDGTPFQLDHFDAGGALQVKAALGRPGTLHRVEVILSGRETLGHFSDRVILKTNRADSLPLTIEVQGEVVGPIRVTPSAMTLGTVEGYQEVTRRINISGRDAPFHLEDVGIPTLGWRAQFRCVPSSFERTKVVELTIRVPNSPGVIEAVIQVKARTEEGRLEILTLPVSGVVVRRAP